MRNGVARPNLAVHLCGSHGGTHTGTDGSSAQSIEDLAIYRSLPNMVVMHPCDDVSTEILTNKLLEIKSPSYTRTARNKTPRIYDTNDSRIQIGKGVKLRDGTDVAIIACGVMVSKSLEAADDLQNNFGIDVEIIDLQTLRPIDSETIEKFISKVSRALEELGQNEISTTTIGTMVMEGLKELDPVAYVRFASVYRNIREQKEFIQIVDKIDVFKKR